ncbi:LrgB family protein [Staphylococcus pasteuri]|uniref:Holin-like protein CidB n=2 Tax=Staphylococcus TaxID=1279 RepID=A0ABY1H426_9STAP|nr:MULTISPECIES: LrgB family protein [Staphylococcus]ODB81973.1 holin [Staphylococcus sp. AOAB]RQX27422.1 LrgB family protein [Staphylococcus warneri]ATH61784.1 holin [Staphylococcus pasteuri]MBL3399078.1 LrgB family protein [Staphylococcus pasteuri]MBM6507969.1 LrgB family protein [Staphylococcus pasteuri]
MNNILQAAVMIIITIVVYVISKKLQDKYKNPFLNPALIASIIIIAILLMFDISYKGYMKGGEWINHILNATVVCLAYPLYQNRHKIKKYLFVIFTSVLTGVILNFMLVYVTLKIFGYSKETIVTMLPRSITAAVGIEVSNELGGTDTMTVLFIIATGLIGSILGSMLLRMGGFKSSIARGLTYGNASHAFGTAKALELDIESGAFSSIGMILTAVISSILIPILILLFY